MLIRPLLPKGLPSVGNCVRVLPVRWQVAVDERGVLISLGRMTQFVQRMGSERTRSIDFLLICKRGWRITISFEGGLRASDCVRVLGDLEEFGRREK